MAQSRANPETGNYWDPLQGVSETLWSRLSSKQKAGGPANNFSPEQSPRLIPPLPRYPLDMPRYPLPGQRYPVNPQTRRANFRGSLPPPIGWSTPLFKPLCPSSHFRPDSPRFGWNNLPARVCQTHPAEILVWGKFNLHAKREEFLLAEFGELGFAEDFNCHLPSGVILDKKGRTGWNHSEWVIKADYSGLDWDVFTRLDSPTPSCFHSLFICPAPLQLWAFPQFFLSDPLPGTLLQR